MNLLQPVAEMILRPTIPLTYPCLGLLETSKQKLVFDQAENKLVLVRSRLGGVV